MALPQNIDAIRRQVLQELENTPYACSELTPVSGGNGNFTFRGTLLSDLADGTHQVLVKHGEPYSAMQQNLDLPTSRCRSENRCLEEAARLAPVTNPTCVVRTPKVYQFDSSKNNQVMEYLGQGMSLKDYVLKNYPSPTDHALETSFHNVGRGLGEWLRNFHDWVKLPEQSALHVELKSSKKMQALKNMINYTWLLERVDQFPSILTDAKPIFEQVQKMSKAELEDDSKLQIIHGDYWTGNALIPNGLIDDGSITPMFIVDWEMAQLGLPAMDLGQMVAELWEFTLFKNITAGIWMVNGLVAGYGALSDDVAFRAALQVGTHLLAFGTVVQGWGTTEQVDDVARMGRDVIVNAWNRDRQWFVGHPLECLFNTA